jgi:hypothetical protein
VKCLNCGHDVNQHNLGGDRGCRVRILTDWSQMEETYTGFRRCRCESYRGLIPTPVSSECPHEFLAEGGCVFCGAARVVGR